MKVGKYQNMRMKVKDKIQNMEFHLSREDEDGGMGSNIFLVGGAVVFLAVFLRYFFSQVFLFLRRLRTMGIMSKFNLTNLNQFIISAVGLSSSHSGRIGIANHFH